MYLRVNDNEPKQVVCRSSSTFNPVGLFAKKKGCKCLNNFKSYLYNII